MECTFMPGWQYSKRKVTLEREDFIVLIKDIPAEVFTNCGHHYLSEEITRLVMEKGNKAIESGAELEVFKLKVA